MKILNPAVSRDIAEGRPIKLNLGSGCRRVEGHYGVDVVELPGLDILADLNAPFSELPDNCVESIYCRHTLEHVTRFMELVGEMHRITRPGGTIEVVVPHFSNPYYYSDPTHVRFFGLYSFHYFCDETDQPRRKVPSFYTPIRFQVESVRFNLMKESLFEKAVKATIQPLVNLGIGGLDWYERRACRLFPVSDVRYILKPVKADATRRAA